MERRDALYGAWEELMKYAVQMGSDAKIYVPNFVNIGSGIQNVI
jgi:hypothetical protein